MARRVLTACSLSWNALTCAEITGSSLVCRDKPFCQDEMIIRIQYRLIVHKLGPLPANQHPSTAHWFCNNCWIAVDYDFRIDHPVKILFITVPSSPAVPSSTRPVTPPSRCRWWIHACTPPWVWLWTGSSTTFTGPTPETNPSRWPRWTLPRDASSSTVTWASPGA